MAGVQQLIDFFWDPFYLNIFSVTVIVFLGMWVLWVTYHQLSKRNLFKLQKKPDEEVTAWKKFLHYLKYIFLLPFLIFFWFLLFVLCLLLLTETRQVEYLMFLGIVLVSSIRIAAYVHQSMAEDLAKTLPLMLLVGLLLNPDLINISITTQDFSTLQEQIPKFAKYLLFIILLEFVMKVIYLVKHRKRISASAKERPREKSGQESRILQLFDEE